MVAKYAVAAAAVAGLVSAAPAAVTSAIAPKETAPAGCSPNYDGTFEIQVINVTSSKNKRDESTPLISTLKDGVLTDAKGRTGYIASNYQFQYDGPPQAGAIYTAGFSVCSNGSLALGDSAIFYQCLSGTFYNLYDTDVAAQCSPVYIEVIRESATSGSATVGQAMKDGQVTALPVSNVACQIGDGQLQQNTCTGQVVTQIGDGQIQAATGVVTQIGDGQIQAPTATANPVTQIGDGQIQAPASTGRPVSQIGDGQIQAANGTVSAQPSVAQFTGAASTLGSSIFGLVACFAAVLAL